VRVIVGVIVNVGDAGGNAVKVAVDVQIGGNVTGGSCSCDIDSSTLWQEVRRSIRSRIVVFRITPLV
jgi:hypothetical protein